MSEQQYTAGDSVTLVLDGIALPHLRRSGLTGETFKILLVFLNKWGIEMALVEDNDGGCACILLDYIHTSDITKQSGDCYA